MTTIIIALALALGVAILAKRNIIYPEDDLRRIPPGEEPILFVPPVIPDVRAYFRFGDKPWKSFDQVPPIPRTAKPGAVTSGYLTLYRTKNSDTTVSVKVVAQINGRVIESRNWTLAPSGNNFRKLTFTAPATPGSYWVSAAVSWNGKVIFEENLLRLYVGEF